MSLAAAAPATVLTSQAQGWSHTVVATESAKEGVIAQRETMHNIADGPCPTDERLL